MPGLLDLPDELIQAILRDCVPSGWTAARDHALPPPAAPFPSNRRLLRCALPALYDRAHVPNELYHFDCTLAGLLRVPHWRTFLKHLEIPSLYLPTTLFCLLPTFSNLTSLVLRLDSPAPGLSQALAALPSLRRLGLFGFHDRNNRTQDNLSAHASLRELVVDHVGLIRQVQPPAELTVLRLEDVSWTSHPDLLLDALSNFATLNTLEISFEQGAGAGWLEAFIEWAWTREVQGSLKHLILDMPCPLESLSAHMYRGYNPDTDIPAPGDPFSIFPILRHFPLHTLSLRDIASFPHPSHPGEVASDSVVSLKLAGTAPLHEHRELRSLVDFIQRFPSLERLHLCDFEVAPDRHFTECNPSATLSRLVTRCPALRTLFLLLRPTRILSIRLGRSPSAFEVGTARATGAASPPRRETRIERRTVEDEWGMESWEVSEHVRG
ncbi:hypothetical protein JCM10450v2_006927 [Rhodotorula kratochvilovae]